MSDGGADWGSFLDAVQGDSRVEVDLTNVTVAQVQKLFEGVDDEEMDEIISRVQAIAAEETERAQKIAGILGVINSIGGFTLRVVRAGLV